MTLNTNMKTLIFTTGVEGLLRKTLESIWDEGQYKGDILVLQYDYFSPKFIKQLEEHNGTIIKANKVYKFINIDRVRMFYSLKDILLKYDVIMHIDGHDIRVFEDINPLLEQAKDKICCIEERVEITKLNSRVIRGSINYQWEGYCNYPNIESTTWWKEMREEYMVNAGLYLGPSKLVVEMLEYMLKEIDTIRTWGIDQVLFNKYIHTHKENIKYVGVEWNYLGWFRNWEVTMDGCLANLGNKLLNIKILHLVNIHIQKNKPWNVEIINKRSL